MACGDLFQLPPVVKDHEVNAIDEKYESVYFFSSNSFKEIKSPSFFELTYSFRQSEDENFYSLLNNIRLGENLEDSINQINRACFNPDFENESSLIITTRKYRAEQINEEMLLALYFFVFGFGKVFTYQDIESLMLLKEVPLVVLTLPLVYAREAVFNYI